MFRFSLFFFSFVFCLLAPDSVRQAGATTVVRFEFDQLCDRAETIAHVRCVESQGVREAESGTIFTRTRLEVVEAVKGSPVTEIVLTLPGGRVDGQQLRVHGIPQFTPGEETVVFLSKPGASGSAWPVGLGQGCYAVRLDTDGKRHVPLRSGAQPLPNGPRSKPTSGGPFQVPLQDFLDQIQRALPPPPADR